MSRPQKEEIVSGQLGWDGVVNDMLALLFDSPLPLCRAADLSELETDFPAANFEQCLAVTQDTSKLYMSDGLDWNEVGSGGGGGGPVSMCRLSKGANQTIGTSSFVAVTFGTGDNEEEDTDGYHNPSSNPERITVPAGLDGKFHPSAQVVFAANTTGARYALIYHKSSGGTLKNRAEATAFAATDSLATNFLVDMGVVEAVAGDYFYLEVYQVSGGNLNLLSIAGGTGTPFYGTRFSVTRTGD